MAELWSAGADGPAGDEVPAETGGLAEAGDPAKAGREGVRGGGGVSTQPCEVIGLHQLPRRRSGMATLRGLGSGELAVRDSRGTGLSGRWMGSGVPSAPANPSRPSSLRHPNTHHPFVPPIP